MKRRVFGILGLALAATLAFVGPLRAEDGRKAVEAFYSELLSQPNRADLVEAASAVLIDDWVSIPTPRGGAGAKGFVATLQGFGQAIPDLNWAPQEILQDGDRYIVRSIATGTPVAPLFGIEPKGKSFEIMSIDIHQVQDGRIVQSYHVEEWAKAMQQLSTE